MTPTTPSAAGWRERLRLLDEHRRANGEFGEQRHSGPESWLDDAVRHADGSLSFRVGGRAAPMHEFRLSRGMAAFTHAIIPLRAGDGAAAPGPVLVVAGDSSDPEGLPAETLPLAADSWNPADAIEVLAAAGYEPVGGLLPYGDALETELAPIEEWPGRAQRRPEPNR